MTERRPMGSVEADILAVLWSVTEPLTPAMVGEGLDYELAYTTVTTILVRLWHKGLVEREHHGRGFTYAALVAEDELTAKRMSDELARAHDRTAALSKFLDSLSRKERNALRRKLSDGSSRR